MDILNIGSIESMTVAIVVMGVTIFFTSILVLGISWIILKWLQCPLVVATGYEGYSYTGDSGKATTTLVVENYRAKLEVKKAYLFDGKEETAFTLCWSKNGVPTPSEEIIIEPNESANLFVFMKEKGDKTFYVPSFQCLTNNFQTPDKLYRYHNHVFCAIVIDKNGRRFALPFRAYNADGGVTLLVKQSWHTRKNKFVNGINKIKYSMSLSNY